MAVAMVTWGLQEDIQQGNTIHVLLSKLNSKKLFRIEKHNSTIHQKQYILATASYDCNYQMKLVFTVFSEGSRSVQRMSIIHPRHAIIFHVRDSIVLEFFKSFCVLLSKFCYSYISDYSKKIYSTLSFYATIYNFVDTTVLQICFNMLLVYYASLVTSIV